MKRLTDLKGTKPISLVVYMQKVVVTVTKHFFVTVTKLLS